MDLYSDKGQDLSYFEANKVIYLQGDRSSCFYIINKGKVRLLKGSKEGRLVPLAVLGEKEFLGVPEIFLQTDRLSSAVALESTELLAITRNDIAIFLKRSPQWIEKIMRTLAERLKIVQDMVGEYRVQSEKLNGNKPFSNEDEVRSKGILQNFIEEKRH